MNKVWIQLTTSVDRMLSFCGHTYLGKVLCICPYILINTKNTPAQTFFDFLLKVYIIKTKSYLRKIPMRFQDKKRETVINVIDAMLTKKKILNLLIEKYEYV